MINLSLTNGEWSLKAQFQSGKIQGRCYMRAMGKFQFHSWILDIGPIAVSVIIIIQILEFFSSVLLEPSIIFGSKEILKTFEKELLISRHRIPVSAPLVA